jgi:aminomethyltransferase
MVVSQLDNMMRTTLYEIHQSLNAKMEPFAGYEMPIVYSSIIEEHQAVRQRVGVFDVSHMGEILIQGPDAGPFVDYVFSNEVQSKLPGKVVYGMFLTQKGTVVDDLLVYKESDTSYFLVVNASNTDKDFAWLLAHTEGFQVDVTNLSLNYSQIAIQGPLAEVTMLEVFDLDLSDLGFYQFKKMKVHQCEFIVSRTGYTGEDGFELYGDHLAIRDVFSTLISAHVTPCGLGARDTLRFEAALPLYGHEISDEITPLEAGLKMFVRFDKPDFIGKKALEAQMEAGITRKVVGIELYEKAIPRQGYLVFMGEKEVGIITTGYLSITLSRPIAMALVNRDAFLRQTEVAVAIRNKRIKGFVRDKKFLEKNYKK